MTANIANHDTPLHPKNRWIRTPGNMRAVPTPNKKNASMQRVWLLHEIKSKTWKRCVPNRQVVATKNYWKLNYFLISNIYPAYVWASLCYRYRQLIPTAWALSIPAKKRISKSARNRKNLVASRKSWWINNCR